MIWITRSHVHVDRVACPWLITRFIDSDADFLFVPKSEIERRRQGNRARSPLMHRGLNWAITKAVALSSRLF